MQRTNLDVMFEFSFYYLYSFNPMYCVRYLQNFDLEGESGIVARGIGTAVTLVKLHDVLGFPCDSANIEE